MAKNNDLETDWTGIRHTDPRATVIRRESVKMGTPVIKVTNASIRNATVSGYFELAKGADSYNTFNGKRRAEVKCYWYGKRPTRCWMNITLADNPVLEKNYSGEVIVDIGRQV
jgi:hypothetical protein